MVYLERNSEKEQKVSYFSEVPRNCNKAVVQAFVILELPVVELNNQQRHWCNLGRVGCCNAETNKNNIQLYFVK